MSQRVGQALKSKGGKTYLKFEKDVVIKANEALFLSTPAEDIEYLLNSGTITQEEANLKLAKVPEFVLYNIKQVSTKTV